MKVPLLCLGRPGPWHSDSPSLEPQAFLAFRPSQPLSAAAYFFAIRLTETESDFAFL